jgi:putative component of membrane protein insertase Oxa1/YidC/SpoIIIJ protein YidD
LLLFSYTAVAEDGQWEPWDGKSSSSTKTQYPWAQTPISSDKGYASQQVDFLMSIFQQYLSPLNGPACPHYPTCSAYGRQSVREYGALLGMWMTADRLMREYPGMPESGRYPLIFINRHFRVFDPPQWNHLGEDEINIEKQWRFLHENIY